jgi:[acyl-carrier-protein] S-malonyltransferase
MGRDLYQADVQARELFEQADAILGFPLSTICFEGPEETLRQTHNTQPAIFVHSMVVAHALKRIRPDMVAGHSLGEYSALVAAGALPFADGLRLVRLRGELMQRAGEKNAGTMAAVVGLSEADVEQICCEASDQGVVRPANFNSPGQIVLSGSVAGVRRAMELARSSGAKLVKELVVSGAFHSPLMQDASEGLHDGLERAPMRDAQIPVYTNVTAEPVTAAREIRGLLFRQLTSPVRWEHIVRNMVRDGATRFLEIGPGKVLQGLVKRTSGSVEVGGVDKYSDLTVVQGSA